MTSVQKKQAEAEQAALEAEAQEVIMASKYASLFEGSDLGREVMADMERKSGLKLRIFAPENDYNPIKAAAIDGTRGFMIYIHTMIEKAKANRKAAQ